MTGGVIPARADISCTSPPHVGQRLTKLLLRPIGSKVKTSFPVSLECHFLLLLLMCNCHPVCGFYKTRESLAEGLSSRSLPVFVLFHLSKVNLRQLLPGSSQLKWSWLVVESKAILRPVENTFYWGLATWMSRISELKSERSCCIAASLHSLPVGRPVCTLWPHKRLHHPSHDL